MGRFQAVVGKSLIVSNSGNPETDGTYLLQKTLINNRKWYIKDNTSPTVDVVIAWDPGINFWVLYPIGLPFTFAISNSSSNNPWETTWDNSMIVSPITLTNNKISIKAQNLTVSEGSNSNLPRGINPNGIYLLQNSFINGKPWYSRPVGQVPIGQDGILRMIYTIQGWIIQYNLNNWLLLTSATNVSNDPWEATWPNNIRVSLGSGGKISLFFDTLPLNTQSIKLNLGYEIGGCGNDFVLGQQNAWVQNSCDYNVRWDNKNGTLPYKWRFFYSSDGRTDYASHPTAGPDALPKKGWSNGMTISENQLITFGQSLVLNNLPFDADANCNFSIFNRTWIYLGAPSFRYRSIDSLSYYINTPLTPAGYGGNGSYQITSSDEVYFTNRYSNSDKFPSNNWQLASYIINTCPQITTTPIFSLL